MQRYIGTSLAHTFTTTLTCSFIGLLCLVLVLPTQAETTRHIEVNGTGVISQPPDMAITEFSFSQRALQAAQGKAIIDTQMTNLLKLCEKLGIAKKDIQAAQLSLYPEYDYKNTRKLTGYQVRRQVEIKVRDLADYPALLDGAMGIGATHSGSLTLDFSDRDALEQQAMVKAFDQAKQKAALLARQVNGKLGKATWISESGSAPPTPSPMRATREFSTAADYPAGEVEVVKQLLVRFELIEN